MDNDPLNTQPNQPETEEPKVPEIPEEPTLEAAPEAEEPKSSEVPEEPVLETTPETPLAEPTLTTVPEEPEEAKEEEKSEEPITTGPVNFNISSADEAPAIEPIAPTSVVEQKPKKKSSNVLTLIAIFLALCGVGFGVYGFFFQPPKTITKTVEVPGECKEDEEVAKSSKDYIYVGEWSVKIKKPEAVSSYVVKGNTLEFKDSTESSVSIVRVDKKSVDEGTAEWTKEDKAAYENEDYYFYAKYNKSAEDAEPTEAETALYNALSNSEIFSVF